MGIEIHFLGCLDPLRVPEFDSALKSLTRSLGGGAKQSQFILPADVMTYVRGSPGSLGAAASPRPRRARGDRVLVWSVTTASFGTPFPICCNIDWQGALVHYGSKNWGMAYPMVSDRERLMHEDLDPTIYEAPVCIRRSHTAEGHLDAIKIVDLIREKFDPGLWVHDDTGYYERRELEGIRTAIETVSSWLTPPATGTFSVPEHLKHLSQAELLRTSVDDLNLPLRYAHGLKQAEILTIGDLARQRLSHLQSIENMTDQGIRYIRGAMKSLGLLLSE